MQPIPRPGGMPPATDSGKSPLTDFLRGGAAPRFRAPPESVTGRKLTEDERRANRLSGLLSPEFFRPLGAGIAQALQAAPKAIAGGGLGTIAQGILDAQHRDNETQRGWALQLFGAEEDQKRMDAARRLELEAKIAQEPGEEGGRRGFDRTSPFGTSSRFLSVGTGYDPSTRTAKNTDQMVKDNAELKKEQQEANRILREMNAKQPNVVGAL